MVPVTGRSGLRRDRGVAVTLVVAVTRAVVVTLVVAVTRAVVVTLTVRGERPTAAVTTAGAVTVVALPAATVGVSGLVARHRQGWRDDRCGRQRPTAGFSGAGRAAAGVRRDKR